MIFAKEPSKNCAGQNGRQNISDHGVMQACSKCRLVNFVTYMDDIIKVSIKWQLVSN